MFIELASIIAFNMMRHTSLELAHFTKPRQGNDILHEIV